MSESPGARRLLQRQILPVEHDLDVLPLYVDPEAAVLDADKFEIGANPRVQQMSEIAMRQATATGEKLHPEQIESRTSFRVLAGDDVSFGTYFNAFAASYWRRWTVVSSVTLTVRLRGGGGRLTVMKSMANGRSQRVESVTTKGPETQEFTFELTLKPFVDGGWYWYDVVAADEDVVVEGAEWTATVPQERAGHGTLDLAITTMDRPDFCAELLQQLGSDETLRDYLDTVLVMEQGSDPVTGSEHFPAAEAALGDTLRVLEQGNLGGSGGYARGQLESVRKGTADYLLCMDDDVICETEGIIRAVTFSDLARRPTIVGGHMFSIYARSRLHSFGEVVQPWRFWWDSAPGVHKDWDFKTRNLRSARWLHKRVDVDYNGWFMCLIPRSVLERIGLSLPLFIKWDDSEYGLRAQEAGVATVSLPGVAVWHIPWTDKNDALDWQSYFHQRNRFVAALLHSRYRYGGRMVQESFNHQVKHLVSMQYSTVALRHQALEDVLAGPEKLHADLPTKLSEVKATTRSYTDAQLQGDPDAFPEVRRTKPPRKGKEGPEVPGRWSLLASALTAPLRQLKPPRELARTHPEVELPAMDAQWYRLTKHDAAVVSMPDGTSAALYQRDPEEFRYWMARTVEIHARLRREWPRLAQEYRDALADITAPEAWEETLAPWRDGDDG